VRSAKCGVRSAERGATTAKGNGQRPGTVNPPEAGRPAQGGRPGAGGQRNCQNGRRRPMAANRDSGVGEVERAPPSPFVAL
jgi:hypothetical protein